MALNEERLKNKIIAIIEECQQEETDPNASKTYFATNLAKAIVEEIKEAKLTYSSGLIAPSGGGSVTGNLNSVIIS